MSKLDKWLRAEKMRNDSRPRLEDALFSRRPFAYIAYRLRFVTLRVVLRTALHLIEVAALSHFLLPRALVPLLVLRNVTFFAQSLWWGALEPQRMALREAHRNRDDGAYASISSRWASLAAFVAAGELGLIGLCLLLPTYGGPALGIYGVYALACGWRLSLDTWSRTVHSAVYAVGRVQRPLWSMLFVDFLEVFGLIWAWLRIGPVALALTIAVCGTLRSLLLVHFTERTRVRLGLPPRSRSVYRELARGSWRSLPGLQSLKFAALNATLQVESLIVIVLGLGIGGHAGALLSMTIHAFSPLLGGGYGWARVFYFDLKRVEALGQRFFARRMGRLLDRVALVFPLVLLGLVLPVATLLAPELVPDTPIAVAAFVMARSLFSLRQLEAFGYVDWRVQLRQALALLLALTAIPLFAPQPLMFLVAVTGAFLIAALAGRRASLSLRPMAKSQTVGLEAWIEGLLRSDEVQWVAVLALDRSTTTMPKLRDALLEIDHAKALVRLGPSRWVTTVDARLPEPEARERLVAAAGGSVASVQLSGPVDRTNLRRQLLETDVLARRLTEISDDRLTNSSVTLERLERDFFERFPAGRCLSESAGSLARLPECNARELPHVLHDSLSNNHESISRRNRRLAVIPYRPKGDLTRIFVVSVTMANAAALREFESIVVAHALRETLA